MIAEEKKDCDPQLEDRLQAIVNVERKIDDLMKCSKDCLSELSKEKQISKSKMEESSQNFRKLLNQIESELSTQMQYLGNVCVGSAHQGSTFASQQNISLAELTGSALHEDARKLAESLPTSADSDETIASTPRSTVQPSGSEDGDAKKLLRDSFADDKTGGSKDVSLDASTTEMELGF